MNYNILYSKFIESRPIRVKPQRLDGSLCVHHILPRSLGGNNDPDNLIVLTLKEHYFAHKLLYKMQPKGLAKSKMAGALIFMLRSPRIRGIITSRKYAIEYDKHRQYNIEQATSHWQDPEYRANWYRGRYGKEAPKAFLSADYKATPRAKTKPTDIKVRAELLKEKYIKRSGSISRAQQWYLNKLAGVGPKPKRTRAEQDALNARVRLGVLKYWTEDRKAEARAKWTDERRAVYSARMKKLKIHLYRKA